MRRDPCGAVAIGKPGGICRKVGAAAALATQSLADQAERLVLAQQNKGFVRIHSANPNRRGESVQPCVKNW
jgi:hypothetical protein